MDKIKYQLESAIEKKISNLVLANFEFIVEGKPAELSQIKGVELYQPNDFDDILRDGKSHSISLKGVVHVFEKTRKPYFEKHSWLRDNNHVFEKIRKL